MPAVVGLWGLMGGVEVMAKVGVGVGVGWKVG